MKQLVCERCGGNDFTQQNGYRICEYCGTRFVIQAEDKPQKSSRINLNDDLELLLKKCTDDPANAFRYARLVLDIDPSNSEAMKFTKQNKRRR